VVLFGGVIALATAATFYARSGGQGHWQRKPAIK
jgi:hypothetical protein